ncbi:MAG: HAD-IB family hydrolase [Coriobacteriia bacterium]|nr:HAD-IB family hydrolase [Coriobacteriia bacterium]
MPVEPVCIVAFDFDGTLLEGLSPVRMMRRLLRRRIIPLSVAFKTLWWAVRYKLRLPVEQARVREYIFSAFTHISAAEANKIMSDFYQEDLRHRLRPKALATIHAHKQAGDTIVLVSASFLPILREVIKDVEADRYICTEMEVEDGHYTSNVAHPPPEGEQKLIQLAAWADVAFADSGWTLGFAYGDHRSDAALLAAAATAVAVNPDSGLERIARREGWGIVDWSFRPTGGHSREGRR